MQHGGAKRPFSDSSNKFNAGANVSAINDKSTKPEVEAWLKSFLSEAEVEEVADAVVATGHELVGKFVLQLNEKVSVDIVIGGIGLSC